MFKPLSRTKTVDLGAEPLPPCWLRLRPTTPDPREVPAAGLWRTGPKGSFLSALLEAINSAREVILVASFLLAEEKLAQALLRAAESGRRVYVLTASEQRLARLPKEEEGFDARMLEEHKRLLDSLAGRVLLRSAEHFHAKFLATDPASNPRAWLSTANFNRALSESLELGVALEPEEALGLTGWFSYAFWREAERELTGKGRLTQVGPPPALPLPPRSPRVFATTGQHRALQEEVLRLIQQARRELVVSSYGLDPEHATVKALIERARTGLPVTVLTRPRPAAHVAVRVLQEAGVQVLAHDKLHAKAVVSETEALVMTANLQSQGLDQGFEVGVRLEGARHGALRDTLYEWAESFPWRYAAQALRREHLGELWRAERGQREGTRQVVEEEQVELPPVVARSALELEQAPEPECKVSVPVERYPRRVRFHWEVRPPRLPEKAREQRRRVTRKEQGKDGKVKRVEHEQPYEPPVYEHEGKRYVLVSKGEEIEPARRLAAELGAVVVVK